MFETKQLLNPFYVSTLGIGTALLAISTSLVARENQTIKIDGSSTVYPITKEIVEEYQASQKKLSEPRP